MSDPARILESWPRELFHAPVGPEFYILAPLIPKFTPNHQAHLQSAPDRCGESPPSRFRGVKKVRAEAEITAKVINGGNGDVVHV